MADWTIWGCWRGGTLQRRGGRAGPFNTQTNYPPDLSPSREHRVPCQVVAPHHHHPQVKKKKINKTLCVWSQWTFFWITVFYHRVLSWKVNQKYVPLVCEWKSVLYCLGWNCALQRIFMAIGRTAMSERGAETPTEASSSSSRPLGTWK